MAQPGTAHTERRHAQRRRDTAARPASLSIMLYWHQPGRARHGAWPGPAHARTRTLTEWCTVLRPRLACPAHVARKRAPTRARTEAGTGAGARACELAQRTSTRSIGLAWQPYMKIYKGDGGKNIKYKRGAIIRIDSIEIQMYRNS